MSDLALVLRALRLLAAETGTVHISVSDDGECWIERASREERTLVVIGETVEESSWVVVDRDRADELSPSGGDLTAPSLDRFERALGGRR